MAIQNRYLNRYFFLKMKPRRHTPNTQLNLKIYHQVINISPFSADLFAGKKREDHQQDSAHYRKSCR